MFLIKQYYLLNGEIKSHICNISETFESAYNSLIEVYKILPEDFIIFSSIPDKVKDELLKFILNKNKDKSILTIVSA